MSAVFKFKFRKIFAYFIFNGFQIKRFGISFQNTCGNKALVNEENYTISNKTRNHKDNYTIANIINRLIQPDCYIQSKVF